MKTLQSKITTMLSLMLAVSLVLAFLLIRDARNKNRLSAGYEVANALAGHLNAAAGWQAIERGVGATILGAKGTRPGRC